MIRPEPISREATRASSASSAVRLSLLDEPEAEIARLRVALASAQEAERRARSERLRYELMAQSLRQAAREAGQGHLEMLDQLQESESKAVEAAASLQEQSRALALVNAELERFAYVASHDLQEPLRTITCYVQLLSKRLEEGLTPQISDYLRFVVEGAARMRRLIQDLLAFSKLTREPGAEPPASCEEAYQEALAALTQARLDSQARITSDPLPLVRCSKLHLVRLFQNLLSNALKFCGEEPPRIHVGCRRSEEVWQITVSDNGIGIEPRFQERVFQAFQKLHPESEYPGTGLGLASCSKIVERYGGKIWVESREGAGAAFHFTLPTVDLPNEGVAATGQVPSSGDSRG